MILWNPPTMSSTSSLSATTATPLHSYVSEHACRRLPLISLVAQMHGNRRRAQTGYFACRDFNRSIQFEVLGDWCKVFLTLIQFEKTCNYQSANTKKVLHQWLASDKYIYSWGLSSCGLCSNEFSKTYLYKKAQDWRKCKINIIANFFHWTLFF